MKRISLILVVLVLSLLGVQQANAQSHYTAAITFSNKQANKCPLIAAGTGATLDFYVTVPDGIGSQVLYSGGISGWTANGDLVSGTGRLVMGRRGDITVDFDTLYVIEPQGIDSVCVLGQAKYKVTLVPAP